VTNLGDQSEDVNLLLLTNSVRSVHGLEIGLRVPVRVKEHDNVGRGQVDAEAASPCGKEEDELFRIGLVVGIDGSHAVFMDRAAVQPAVLW
jgi:hypothetical protein